MTEAASRTKTNPRQGAPSTNPKHKATHSPPPISTTTTPPPPPTITTTTTTEMDIDPQPSPPTLPNEEKNKKKKKKKPSPHILHQSTHRNPDWKYFVLRLIIPSSPTTTTTTTTSSPKPTTPPQQTLDVLTALTLLTTPLQAYLGHTGAAIPMDMLQIAGFDVTVRVPREDARAFRAAVSCWVGGGVERGVLVAGDGGGGGGMERVQVAWRVLGEVGAAGGLVGGVDGGMGLFE